MNQPGDILRSMAKIRIEVNDKVVLMVDCILKPNAQRASRFLVQGVPCESSREVADCSPPFGSPYERFHRASHHLQLTTKDGWHHLKIH